MIVCVRILIFCLLHSHRQLLETSRRAAQLAEGSRAGGRESASDGNVASFSSL
eukprot:SAG11_NODE_32157_length_285_cov_18.747312_1_plen_52_part_01